MKDLLLRQAQLDAALDLDKNEMQIVRPEEDDIGLADAVPQGPSISRPSQRNPAPGMSP
jgi:hypothetical protein